MYFRIFFITFIIYNVVNVTYAKDKNKIKNTNKANIETKYGVYLGLKNFGTPKAHKKFINTFDYRFFVGGKEKIFKVRNLIKNEKEYYIQNILQEGYIYILEIYNNKVINRVRPIDNIPKFFVQGIISKIDKNNIYIGKNKYKIYDTYKIRRILQNIGGSRVVNCNLKKGIPVKMIVDKFNNIKLCYVSNLSKQYKPPIKPIPGLKTIKNYIGTALSAVGSSLYIFGGTWNWQSNDNSLLSSHIGIPQSWIDFFNIHDASYSYKEYVYKNKSVINKKLSYYPFNKINTYYYAGVDCSAFMGWVLYNILHTKSNLQHKTTISSLITSDYLSKGWGKTLTAYELKKPKNYKNSQYKVGDIVSTKGHCWICLGTCNDGSIIFVHSSPGKESRLGELYRGSGPQISAIGNNDQCDAYKLADYYMKKYYPKWYKRYKIYLVSYEDYTNFANSQNALFRWDTSGSFMSDPENYQNKKPEEILKDIFNENNQS